MRFLILAVSLLSVVNARVTFQYSEVLQAPDLGNTNKATFTCKNVCKVFADIRSDKLVVTQNGGVVASLSTIVGPTVFTPIGFLLQAGDYQLENRGEINPQFVVYVVDITAPNNGASVVAPQETIGVTTTDKSRYVTVLSSFESAWFSTFSGQFPAGYPRIYAAGYDAGFDQCHPVYQARSQYNAEMSWPTIAAAVLTIDFGFVGAHNVSVNQRKIKQMSVNRGTTAVYTSPGYVGCSSTAGQNYFSKLSQVQDAYTLTSDDLNIDGVYSGLANDETLRLIVNNQIVNLVGSGNYTAHYNKKSFDVSISWTRRTAGSNFALQLDFGNFNDPQYNNPSQTTPTIGQATTSSDTPLNALCALALVIAASLR